MPSTETVTLHLFLTNVIGGAAVVLLLETEPGVVEFPRLTMSRAETDDEDALVDYIAKATGIHAEISGFLDPPREAPLDPPGSRILLARVVSGSPKLILPHVGWEWTSGAELVRMPFAPRVMVDELRSFMNV